MCKLLRKIPNLPSLTNLDNSGCSMIISMPVFPNLKILNNTSMAQ
jgi:hypothetical protein